jgi:hypothetical protein
MKNFVSQNIAIHPIAKADGLSGDGIVKGADKDMLQTEWKSLMLGEGEKLEVYTIAESKFLFLEAFRQLTTK